MNYSQRMLHFYRGLPCRRWKGAARERTCCPDAEVRSLAELPPILRHLEEPMGAKGPGGPALSQFIVQKFTAHNGMTVGEPL